jgi:chromosome segregation ATPase
VDGQFKRLTADLGSTGKLVEQVKQELKSTATALRKTLGEGDKKLRGEVPQLRTSVNDLRRRLLDADQVLRDRISKLQAKVGQVSTDAHNADVRSKDEKARVKELDKEVRAGLRQVQALQGSAKGASRDIGILIDRVTALERALR